MLLGGRSNPASRLEETGRVKGRGGTEGVRKGGREGGREGRKERGRERGRERTLGHITRSAMSQFSAEQGQWSLCIWDFLGTKRVKAFSQGSSGKMQEKKQEKRELKRRHSLRVRAIKRREKQKNVQYVQYVQIHFDSGNVSDEQEKFGYNFFRG